MLTGEQANRDPLMQNMDARDLNWWKSEVASWSRVSGKDRGAQLAAGQRKSFFGLVAFLKSDQAVRQNLPGAGKYLAIYELAEPDNPEVNFLRAMAAGAKGDANAVFTQLEKAVAKGFYRADRIKDETYFQGIQSQNPQRFQTLIQQANAQKY